MSDTFDHEADAWDDLLFGRGHYGEEQPRAAITCQRCGAVGLHWEDTGRHWRLATDDMQAHNCAEAVFAKYVKP